MTDWLYSSLALFADAAAPAAGAAGGAGAAGEAQEMPFMLRYLPIIAVAILGYFLILRPQTKQVAALRERVDKLKKGDRLLTKAGIYGTVVSVDKEQNRLILKIDESTNTKIEVTLNSIDYVIPEKSSTTST